jgi:hypothetical protein
MSEYDSAYEERYISFVPPLILPLKTIPYLRRVKKKNLQHVAFKHQLVSNTKNKIVQGDFILTEIDHLFTKDDSLDSSFFKV